MWQITWMLGFLPDWFWTLVLWAGIASIGISYLLAKIPVILQYKFPLRLGGVIALLIGVYFQGVIANEEKWQVRVKELEAKLAVAENKSKEENVKIEEKIVTKTKIIKEKGKDIIQYIDREVVKNNEIIKYIESCPLPKDIIDIHNSAVRMIRPEGEKK
jgi:hypothetical protein